MFFSVRRQVLGSHLPAPTHGCGRADKLDIEPVVLATSREHIAGRPVHTTALPIAVDSPRAPSVWYPDG